MKSKVFGTLLAALLLGIKAQAQLPDCTLGIGGKDNKTIIQVFQLNDEQQSRLDQWVAELGQENKLTQDQIKILFDTHPQQNQEDLVAMAGKYNKLLKHLEQTSKLYDTKLLGIFNERQYQRYAELCSEALRKPMIPVRTVPEVTVPE